MTELDDQFNRVANDVSNSDPVLFYMQMRLSMGSPVTYGYAGHHIAEILDGEQHD